MHRVLKNSVYADRGIILTGQIYEYKLKKFNEAESQYLRIINEHPSSVFSEPIRFHIRRLEQKEFMIRYFYFLIIINLVQTQKLLFQWIMFKMTI